MSSNYKGILLAGGTGSRLSPLTKSLSKQLLPVFDKPMIYYPLSTLMLAGIREILLITTPRDIDSFKNLLGDGSLWGMSIEYAIQPEPKGIAQSFLIAESFLNNSPTTLILGDNLFHGNDLVRKLSKSDLDKKGGTIFSYFVRSPERYGVVEFDKDRNVICIEEKPKFPKSRYAVTGIYCYDNTVVERAKNLVPSYRGELEITDINQSYLNEGNLKVEILGRGMAWLDTGTFDSLQEAGIYIKTLEKRQGLKVGCPEEIAWRLGWIDEEKLLALAKPLTNSGYGKYLESLIEENFAI